MYLTCDRIPVVNCDSQLFSVASSFSKIYYYIASLNTHMDLTCIDVTVTKFLISIY